MELRVARASAVIVQRIPPDKVDWFLECQREITAAAREFPGYRGTDIYPPGDSQSIEWVIVIHFDDDATMKHWLESPVRADWMAKLRETLGEFTLRHVPGGFGPWFAELGRDTSVPPPNWKMALVVLLGLYPTVMFLSLFPGPFLAPLGLATSMVIGNALSVSLLQWFVMPMLVRMAGPWMKASGTRRSALGGVVVVALLGAFVIAFRFVTG